MFVCLTILSRIPIAHDEQLFTTRCYKMLKRRGASIECDKTPLKADGCAIPMRVRTPAPHIIMLGATSIIGIVDIDRQRLARTANHPSFYAGYNSHYICAANYRRMCKYVNGNASFHGSPVHLFVECIAATETNDATFCKALVPTIFVIIDDKIVAKGVTIDIRSAIACV